MMFIPLLLAAPRCAAQTLQAGVHVELAATRNAVAMPGADEQGAVIVAVTHNGNVYLGTDPITPFALAKIQGLSREAGKKLYLKADAGTPYAEVMKVLEGLRAARVRALNLLTGQPQLPAPGKRVPPKGLEVLLGPLLPSGTENSVIELVKLKEQRPELRINNRVVLWTNLESQLMRGRGEKMVLVNADGPVSYGNVVHVIDACHASGAVVTLATPTA
jgi:biopolymer transport protein ExbD